MTDPDVAGAAVALRTFSVAQLAAFTGKDRQEVVRSLEELSEWVVPVQETTSVDAGPVTAEGERLWRVVAPERLRDHVRLQGGPRRGPVMPRPEKHDLSELRLVRAEETLVHCAREPSAGAREVMATTAETYLRQYVAAHNGTRDWWQVVLPSPQPGECPDDGDDHGRRLRVNVAMASMTRHEARGREVSTASLVRTATEVSELVSSLRDADVQPLVEWFFELATTMTRTVLQRCDEEAPDHLISALGWRRVRARARPDLQQAASQAVALLRWVDCGPEKHFGLYRFLEHLPDGLNRLSVYADFLPILPEQYTLRPAADIVPGALVEVVADGSAARHLERVAGELEAHLERLPFRSDSALIGVVAASFDDLAARGAALDDGVLPRSVTKRKELLSLADVAVRSPSKALPA